MMKKWPDNDPEAVIFDLDGTLVDSMWMWTDIDKEYLARFGYPFDKQIQREIEGMSIGETAVWFKERYHIPDSLEKIQSDWIRMSIDKYRNEVPLKPFAGEFLTFLKSRGIKTGIASSNAIYMVEACLDSLSVRDKFDIIATASEGENPFLMFTCMSQGSWMRILRNAWSLRISRRAFRRARRPACMYSQYTMLSRKNSKKRKESLRMHISATIQNLCRKPAFCDLC